MDTLLKRVRFDDIPGVQTLNCNAEMLNCAVLFAKSLSMVQAINQLSPLNNAAYWKIIQYTESITIIDYILTTIFPSVTVPKFSIFKNKSVEIVKYLIKGLNGQITTEYFSIHVLPI